jgi:hypothetical protein
MTRLTNAFSKKMENHAHAMSLMAAGVTDRLWEVADMVAVLEAWEAAGR